MTLLRMMICAVLVVSSDTMMYANQNFFEGIRKKIQEFRTESEIRASVEELKKVSLIDACINGQLRYSMQWGKPSPGVVELEYCCAVKDGYMRATTAAEVFAVLQECEQLDDKRMGEHLKRAALRWIDFKNGTDIQDKTGEVAKRNKADRITFLKAIKELKKVSLIDACTKGQLRWDWWGVEKALTYRGPDTGDILRGKTGINAEEVRNVVRECEALATTQSDEEVGDRLKQAALRWINFKNGADLQGYAGDGIERIKENRQAYFKAINTADGFSIAQKAQHTLYYKHPTRHRVSKVLANVVANVRDEVGYRLNVFIWGLFLMDYERPCSQDMSDDANLVAFIDAIFKGKVSADGAAMGCIAFWDKTPGWRRGMCIKELPHILRDHEAKLLAGELSNWELRKAVRRWKSFKDCDDLRGKMGKSAEKIAKNRQDLVEAINGAQDASKIEQASKKSLFFKNPMMHATSSWKKFVKSE